jgi:hypothetical protein
VRRIGEMPGTPRREQPRPWCMARILILGSLVVATTTLSPERQRLHAYVAAAVRAPRPATAPQTVEADGRLESARFQYHTAREAYMRTPSAPGTAEARAFQAAFEAVDLARFGAPQPVSPPSSGLQDAAFRAARLRLIMACTH